MSSIILAPEEKYEIKNNIVQLIISLFLIFLLLLVIYLGISTEKLILIFVVTIIFNLALNFQFSVYFLVSTLFFSFYVNYFHLSIVVSSILLLSLFFTKSNLEIKDLKTPFTISLIIYIISIIPSFINSINPGLSLYKTLNLFAMILVMVTVSASINRRKDIDKIINFYLFLVLLNSLFIIYLASVTGKRVFGFPGVFFVDYVGLGSIISVILFFFEKKIFQKVIMSVISSIFLISLILTQTRNAWLSFVLTLFLLFLYLLFSKKISKSQRIKIVLYSCILIITLVLIYLGAEFINKGILVRTSSISTHKVSSNNLQSIGNNSLLTRFFIWQTAWNAFLSHPIIGIGVNAFSFSSQLYYKLPKIIYLMFVKGSNPHITYLAVLVETGIIGLFGFLVFIVSVIKHALHSLNLKQSNDDFKRSLILNWSFIYITISMFMTDAWLWGQYAVLLGILLGLSSSNFRIISENKIGQ